MFEGFISAFIVNLLAEFGDKTQIAAILLSTKFKNKRLVFMGVCLALVFATLLAVLFGTFVSGLIPHDVIDIIAGIAFIVFGLISIYFSSENNNVQITGKSAFITSFTLVFIMELGDKSQIGNLLLSTKFPIIEVFAGSVLALSLLTFLAVQFGKVILERYSHEITGKIAGLVMVGIGVLFLFGYL